MLSAAVLAIAVGVTLGIAAVCYGKRIKLASALLLTTTNFVK
jgi:hypothetical protein